MISIEKGMIVKSLAGHDKEHYYVVVETMDGYIYAADGRLKTIEHPKKKKQKHVQPVHYIDEIVSREAEIKDSQIRDALKQYAGK